MFRVVLDDGERPVYVVEETDNERWALQVASEVTLVHRLSGPPCSCQTYVQSRETNMDPWTSILYLSPNDAMVLRVE